MSVIDQLLFNVETLQASLDSGDVQRDVLERHREDIIELQQIQLLEGKGSDGEDLRPYYSEDLQPQGWFKSKETAGRYAAWKGTLSYPFSVQRNPDAPNLYITGVFHGDLDVQFNPDTLAIVPTTMYAQQIMAKYGFGVFGLNAEMWGIIWNEFGAKDELITEMRNVLWQ
jgi:hypothetical protein